MSTAGDSGARESSRPDSPPNTRQARAMSLELQGIGKRFPGQGGVPPVLAVDGVDLLARPGEFVSLIGPSGCGKSTVFNLVAGLDQPTAGEVRIGGVPLADRLGASAYMPQRDALLPWRRVIDNVTLPLELRGVPRREARRTAQPLLERFGLGDFGRAWPWQLSGGMRQRVALLRTVIGDPGLMLLDEPFGALDSITRADLQDWLLRAWASTGVDGAGATVLLVTHDISEAVLLADRVYVMTPRPGRIAAVIDVGLPRPRTPELREDDAFVALQRQVRHELHWAIAEHGEFSEEGHRE
jgi:ABC-type nitrate/sulfonate/bicarbonate transport system ATPase subunit